MDISDIRDLRNALEEAQTYEPTMAVESAIAIYRQATGMIDEYNDVRDAAKQRITSIMVETEQLTYDTKAGKASMTSPGVTVSYDAKAIDILLRDDPGLAMRVAP